jgi:hypothetical protein
MPLTDSAHFFSPTLTASSMLVFEAALSSMILATDMTFSLDAAAVPPWAKRMRPPVKQPLVHGRC